MKIAFASDDGLSDAPIYIFAGRLCVVYLLISALQLNNFVKIDSTFENIWNVWI